MNFSAVERTGKCLIGGNWRQRAPILALAQALATALEKKSDWKAIHQELLGDAESAVRALVTYAHDLRMAGDRLDASVLIVVDQFEELLAVTVG